MFPYLEIIKRAYELARSHVWLWAWGLFLSGMAVVNLGSVRLPRSSHEWPSIATDWALKQNPQTASWLFPAVLLGLLLLLIFFGIAKAAVIWSAGEFTKQPQKQEPTLLTSFNAGKKYLWPVMGLQILITVVFLLLLLLFAFPIYYLFMAEATARAIMLLLLAMAIFIPAGVVFGFLHLYGPIFVVLYGRGVNQALALSFRLIRHKLRESIILSAFLIGLEILFLAVVAFTLLLFAIPFGLLLWLLAAVHLSTAFTAVLAAAFLAGIIYVIVLKAGFAVFQNIAWVLAVQEMVRTMSPEEPETAPVPEPEPV